MQRFTNAIEVRLSLTTGIHFNLLIRYFTLFDKAMLLAKCNISYWGIDNEWGNFVNPHRLQACLPDFQLELFSKYKFHWFLVFATVIKNSMIIIAQPCLVSESYLEQAKLKQRRRKFCRMNISLEVLPGWPLSISPNFFILCWSDFKTLS